jgi:carbamoyl-phosphate synthase small subunit
MRGALVLEDGSRFCGQVFGRGLPQRRQVVCATGTPWADLLTVPAYAGQIVVALDAPASGPSQAAAGSTPEGAQAYPCGLILNGMSEGAAHAAAWQNGLAGLSGVDTHALYAHLRRTGPVSGSLQLGRDGEDRPLGRQNPGAGKRVRLPAAPVTASAHRDSRAASHRDGAEATSLVKDVSSPKPYRIYGGGARVVLYDYGVSPDLLAWFLAADCHTTVVPWDYPAERTLEMTPDVVALSGGPGNPAHCDDVIEVFRPLIGEVAVLAVGLGHQLLARSQGARTGAMWCGHRGTAIPVRELDSGRTVATSQSHGYTVLGAPHNARVTHTAIDDGAIEGLAYPDLRAASVQFTPGPDGAASAVAPVWRQLTAGMRAAALPAT